MYPLSCREPDENLKIGKIIEVDGTHIKAELDKNIDELTRVYNTEVYSIGQFGTIIKSYFGNKLLFMYVTRLRLKSEIESERGNYIPPSEDSRILEADLFGEGQWKIECNTPERTCQLAFERGISTYPLPQQALYLTTSIELKSVFESDRRNAVRIGTYVGAGNVPCYANVNEMISKHTAILGSTGSGKSGTVAAIIHAISSYKLNEDGWHPYIIILDPHNEYQTAFPQAKRLVSDEGTLKLPYWLLNLQELTDLFIGKSEFQATSQVNILKTALIKVRKAGATIIGKNPEEVSVDSPIPFSIASLVEEIESDMPPQVSKQDKHRSILNKIEALQRDRRLNFLIDDWTSNTDEIQDVLGQFINSVESIRVVDLSGIPNDIAGIVSATISRLLFMYKLWETSEERKRDPLLLVCEEAHKYVPNRGEAEYTSAQDAIKRIAKEGRKYGIGLILVSQRPSEIEPTVLSQCNTWLVLRLTNSDDQSYVLRFLPDSMAGLAKQLPALRRREAIFIGQAAPIPARIMVNELTQEQLPMSQDIPFIEGWSSQPVTGEQLQAISDKWRVQLRGEFEGGSADEQTDIEEV